MISEEIYDRKGNVIEENFKALYFSTDAMKEAYKNSPEVIFYDGTYKVLQTNMPLHILAVEDPDGKTRVIAVAFVVSEDAVTLTGVMKAFRQDNSEAAEKTKCFMTDKDMSERKVIREVFPEVKLYICGFHVLQAIEKKVNSLLSGKDKKNEKKKNYGFDGKPCL